MVQHLIVPVDGSDASWRVVDVAVALARRCDASVDVIEVVFDHRDSTDAVGRLAERLDPHDCNGVAVSTHVHVAVESVAQAIGDQVDLHPEATVVLASHGRGRSAALLGSVTEELLGQIFGPVLVVGPHVEPATFDGPIVAAVDGSGTSECVLPLAAAWGMDEVADFASAINASLIVASTRGRTGMSRFVIGSTAAAIVRHAPCPVLLVRPPHVHH